LAKVDFRVFFYCLRYAMRILVSRPVVIVAMAV
jgi:hypothetical protein